MNPVHLYRIETKEFLVEELKLLNTNELQSLIKKYMPDPTRNIYTCKNKTKIIDYIIYRAEKLAVKGEVFITETE